jgi:dethiobiotin synthetase
MAGIFITSSGTEMGKTFVVCGLIEAFKKQKKSVQALKPLISGMQEISLKNSDTGLILQALGQDVTPKNAAKISPWQFAAALSPSMAARLENREIVLKDVVSWCQQKTAKSPAQFTLIEGAGGVMAPLNDSGTMLDLMMALKWPVILVVGSYLGALSHTLTAIEALKGKADILAIMVNEKGASGVGLRATMDELARFVPDAIPIIALPDMTADNEAKTIEPFTRLSKILCNHAG